MQEAIPYRTSFHNHSFTTNHGASSVLTASDGMVTKMVVEKAVIVVGRRGCCMCHVIKRLLLGLGVNPPVYDVDDKDEAEVVKQLQALAQHNDEVQLPAVFIGGKLFGGLDRLMASHISGDLVPILKKAGALWL